MTTRILAFAGNKQSGKTTCSNFIHGYQLRSNNIVNAFNVTDKGDLVVDTDTLYVDATNDRVGIGTPSPSANLEIIQSGNNVGLLVSGGGYNYTAKFESSDAEANIIIEDSNSTNNGNMIGVATDDMYFLTALIILCEDFPSVYG